MRFSEGKDNAAWFLMEQTNVDEASAGADTLGELHKLSQEVEEIGACGSFTFKETMMSRDMVANPANPRKYWT
jgi:hypothetical protein